jgi:hypothetical protein
MSAGPTQLRAGGEGGWGLSQAELCDRHRETTARCVRSPSCRRRVQELPRGCRGLSCIAGACYYVLANSRERTMQHAQHCAQQCSIQRLQRRSCARRALQGLPSNTKICGQGVVVTLGKATVCSPGLCCSRVAGGCARVVSSASSPRRTALLVWSGGAPRCSTSGLSPSTSSPRRISARASLLTLESHRVSIPRVAGATFAELHRRRTQQLLHAGLALKSPRVSLPVWLPAAVFVHALAEDETICSTAMARRDRQAR